MERLRRFHSVTGREFSAKNRMRGYFTVVKNRDSAGGRVEKHDICSGFELEEVEILCSSGWRIEQFSRTGKVEYTLPYGAQSSDAIALLKLRDRKETREVNAY